MAVVAILAGEEQARERLKLAVEELGHRAAPAMDLKGAVELLSSDRPRLFLVAQSPKDKTAEALLGELDREAPTLPVVVALTERRSWRAMELMKAGAFDVVAPPWTPEGLAASVTKALRFRGTAFEVLDPRTASRSALYSALAVLAAFALAAGWAWTARLKRLERAAREGPPPSSWELPYAHPAGLAYGEGELWVSDWYARTVYRLDPATRRVTRSVHLPRETPGALAFAADALWSAGPGELVKHMREGGLRVLGRYPVRARTLGLAYDGLYLWTCDAASGRLHKRILDGRLSVVESFPYPGGKPAALTYDGEALWSLDIGNKELLRHDISRPGRVLRRLPLPEYRSGDWQPAGLAFAEGALWSVAQRRPRAQEPARLFRHDLPAEEAR